MSDFHIAGLDDHVRFDLCNGCFRREITEWEAGCRIHMRNSFSCSAFGRLPD